MPIFKNQVLDLKKSTLPVYIIDNYYNTYSEKFALNFILVKNLKS